MKIDLTDQQRQNLITFLQRVQLTGAEVPAYLEIANALNKEFIDKLKNNSKKDGDNHNQS
jgi:hypothetical protein